MAKSARPLRLPANLTVDQKRAAIPRLRDRVKELEALDVRTLRSAADAKVKALETRIEQTLAGIFGPESHEYCSLWDASDLNPRVMGPVYFGVSHAPTGPSVADIQAGIAQRRAAAATMLSETIRTMQEELGPLAEMPAPPAQSTGPRSKFDVMQVCTNGHLITDLAIELPHSRKKFCPTCGAETIEACGDCKLAIPGHPLAGGLLYPNSTPVPDYCVECGAAYPWREGALENLRLILEAAGLDAEDTKAARELLPDLVAETPRSQSAAMRMKRILGKMAGPAYDVTVKVMSDLVSETIKKTLGIDHPSQSG